MTYSACDFMDDICEALGVDWGAVPEDHDDDNDGPTYAADKCLEIIATLKALAGVQLKASTTAPQPEAQKQESVS